MFAFEKDPRRAQALLQRLRLLCGFEETRRPRGAKGKCLGQEMDWFGERARLAVGANLMQI